MILYSKICPIVVGSPPIFDAKKKLLLNNPSTNYNSHWETLNLYTFQSFASCVIILLTGNNKIWTFTIYLCVIVIFHENSGFGDSELVARSGDQDKIVWNKKNQEKRCPTLVHLLNWFLLGPLRLQNHAWSSHEF